MKKKIYFILEKTNINKLKNGESINEVILREQKALEELLEKHKKEKILIVGHSTALASLFSKWCEIHMQDHISIMISIFLMANGITVKHLGYILMIQTN